MAVYERLAAVYMRNGRYRDAVELMTTARQKFPDQAAILAMRSRALSAWEMSEPENSQPSQEPRATEAKDKKKKKDDDGESNHPSGKKKGGKKGGKR